MPDPFTWSDLGRWLFSFRRLVPDKVLRWAWSESELLAQIRVVTAAEPPPQFFVRPDRENPELTHLDFHVFNITPFKLAIVATAGSVMLDSREIFHHEQRLATEVPLPPNGSARFRIRHTLTEPQAGRLRSYASTSARIQLQNGGIYLRTPFGELRAA